MKLKLLLVKGCRHTSIRPALEGTPPIHAPLILTILVAVLLYSTPVRAETFSGTCVAVSDGDTIKVLKNGGEVRVRLEGIDCPEKRQDFGKRAKQYTSGLVFGKMVTVNVVKLDRYGRSVARVYVDGRDVSLELVKAGLAWHYKKYSSDPVLAEAEEDARAKQLRLWALPNPIPPWDFRHKP